MKRLGERIRRKRENLQMKLNDLARQVRISSSALSQIEKAKAFPSIITLKSIADCLHTTVGELIGEHETLSKKPLIKNSEKRFIKENQTAARLYLLSHHDPLKQMETYLIHFAPGSDAKGIMTRHPGQQFCYVSEGIIDFILDGKKYVLEKGDSFYFNSNIEHIAQNISENVAEILWVITPPNILKNYSTNKAIL